MHSFLHITAQSLSPDTLVIVVIRLSSASIVGVKKGGRGWGDSFIQPSKVKLVKVKKEADEQSASTYQHIIRRTAFTGHG